MTVRALVALVIAFPGAAAAEVQPALPTACPAGTRPVASPVIACSLPMCNRDADCPGQACREQALCIRYERTLDPVTHAMVVVEHPAGPCGANDACPGEARCLRAPRCAPAGRAIAPAPPPRGCGQRAGLWLLAPALLASQAGKRRRRRDQQPAADEHRRRA
jgi:hypothetical protein